jgi:hypothetical protein
MGNGNLLVRNKKARENGKNFIKKDDHPHGWSKMTRGGQRSSQRGGTKVPPKVLQCPVKALQNQMAQWRPLVRGDKGLPFGWYKSTSQPKAQWRPQNARKGLWSPSNGAQFGPRQTQRP